MTYTVIYHNRRIDLLQTMTHKRKKGKAAIRHKEQAHVLFKAVSPGIGNGYGNVYTKKSNIHSIYSRYNTGYNGNSPATML